MLHPVPSQAKKTSGGGVIIDYCTVYYLTIIDVAAEIQGAVLFRYDIDKKVFGGPLCQVIGGEAKVFRSLVIPYH